MSKKVTTEDFIKKAISIHGSKYDYSNVIYKKSNDNVIIKCFEHGNFKMSPNNHLSGKGCKKCGYILSSKNKK